MLYMKKQLKIGDDCYLCCHVPFAQWSMWPSSHHLNHGTHPASSQVYPSIMVNTISASHDRPSLGIGMVFVVVVTTNRSPLSLTGVARPVCLLGDGLTKWASRTESPSVATGDRNKLSCRRPVAGYSVGRYRPPFDHRNATLCCRCTLHTQPSAAA